MTRNNPPSKTSSPGSCTAGQSEDPIDLDPGSSQLGDRPAALTAPSSSASGEVFQQEDQDFTTSLLEYGRSIIKSAVKHPPGQSQALEDNLRVTRQKVVTQYEESQLNVAALEVDLSVAKEDLRQLRKHNATLEVDRIKLNDVANLEKTMAASFERRYKDQSVEKRRDLESWKKEVAKRKALEAEVESLRKDKKRKREKVAEIWEKVERARLDKSGAR
jgi:hypothetical protein